MLRYIRDLKLYRDVALSLRSIVSIQTFHFDAIADTILNAAPHLFQRYLFDAAEWRYTIIHVKYVLCFTKYFVYYNLYSSNFETYAWNIAYWLQTK